MNPDTKMVMKRDERQLVELTQRFFINLASGLVFLDKAKFDNDEIVEIDF